MIRLFGTQNLHQYKNIPKEELDEFKIRELKEENRKKAFSNPITKMGWKKCGIYLTKQFNPQYLKAVLSNDLETMKKIEREKKQYFVDGVDTNISKSNTNEKDTTQRNKENINHLNNSTNIDDDDDDEEMTNVN